MLHTHSSLPSLWPEGAASWAFDQAAGTWGVPFLLAGIRQVFECVPLLFPKTQEVHALSL